MTTHATHHIHHKICVGKRGSDRQTGRHQHKQYTDTFQGNKRETCPYLVSVLPDVCRVLIGIIDYSLSSLPVSVSPSLPLPHFYEVECYYGGA